MWAAYSGESFPEIHWFTDLEAGCHGEKAQDGTDSPSQVPLLSNIKLIPLMDMLQLSTNTTLVSCSINWTLWKADSLSLHGFDLICSNLYVSVCNFCLHFNMVNVNGILFLAQYWKITLKGIKWKLVWLYASANNPNWMKYPHNIPFLR